MKVVVDGSNVAYEEQTSDGKPRMANLIAMRRALDDAGFDPVFIVDATLRHDVDDPDQLEALFADQRVHQAPAGTAADRFVLLEADALNARFVSNDRYEIYRDEFDWIEKRRIPFMIIDGRVLLDASTEGSGK